MSFNQDTCLKIWIVIYAFVLMFVFFKLVLGEESDDYDFYHNIDSLDINNEYYKTNYVYNNNHTTSKSLDTDTLPLDAILNLVALLVVS